MQDLRVIGVENGALLVAADDGSRYRIPIDEVLQAKLRQEVPDVGSGRKLAPREIQAHIRSGMSAQDISAVTGVSLEHIQKYEGPVLAEREFVIETALSVPVHTALETDPLVQGATFGTVIRERLLQLGALGERWASWKEAGTGWIIKLSFTANQIDHDARWTFNPRKLALDPQNSEAIALSQQGAGSTPLIPRLRAVHSDERDNDAARFDSGAFDLGFAASPDPATQQGQVPPPAPLQKVSSGDTADFNQTADLLEALRRRRGEREAANFEDEPSSGIPSPLHPSTGSIRIVDVPLTLPGENGHDNRPTAPQPSIPTSGQTTPAGSRPTSGRKNRQSMPSWDEIVFGARPDDDLA